MTKHNLKIFISYAHEDIGVAKRICQDLKRYGLDIWIDYDNVLPGQKWKVAIEDVIKQSSHCLALLSSYSITGNGGLQKEIKSVLEILEQNSETEIHLITIRLDECEPSLTTSDIYYIDLFPESEYRNGLKKIQHIVATIY